jgi:hypothetical protein
MLPHATLEVILKDGRHFALDRHTTKEYLRDWQDIGRDLANGRGVYEPGPKDTSAVSADKHHGSSAIPPPPDWVSAEDASRIWMVMERRKAHYQWWADADWTKAAALIVALLWFMFYTVRWIVRGFMGS